MARISAPRRALLQYLLLAAALLAGCTTIPPSDCGRFDQIRKSTAYDTVYTYSENETKRAERSFAPGSQSSATVARWYTLRLSRSRTQTCDHLYLIKDLFLQRSTDSPVLEELREFYTDKGQLIATKHENLTKQLSKTGYYTASVPLPIPRAAPPGTYRIVTRLVATPPGGRAKTLATASAEFRVR